MVLGGIAKRAVTKICTDVIGMDKQTAKKVGRVAQVGTWMVTLDCLDPTELVDVGTDLFSDEW